MFKFQSKLIAEYCEIDDIQESQKHLPNFFHPPNVPKKLGTAKRLKNLRENRGERATRLYSLKDDILQRST